MFSSKGFEKIGEETDKEAKVKAVRRDFKKVGEEVVKSAADAPKKKKDEESVKEKITA